MYIVARFDQFCVGDDEYIAEPRPVIIILIDEQRSGSIALNVADAAKFAACHAFGFLVQCGIEVCAIKGVADGNEVGNALFVYRGEASHALALYKARLRFCEG